MSSRAQAVENEALALPEKERLEIAMHLLESVDISSPATVNPEAIEQAWIKEAEQRYQAYLAGNEKTHSADDVFNDLRKDDVDQSPLS